MSKIKLCQQAEKLYITDVQKNILCWESELE